MRSVYYVPYENCTPDEPRPGWYIGREKAFDLEDDCISGPWPSKEAACDARAEFEREDIERMKAAQ